MSFLRKSSTLRPSAVSSGLRFRGHSDSRSRIGCSDSKSMNLHYWEMDPWIAARDDTILLVIRATRKREILYTARMTRNANKIMKWDILHNSTFNIKGAKFDDLLKILLANRGLTEEKAIICSFSVIAFSRRVIVFFSCLRSIPTLFGVTALRSGWRNSSICFFLSKPPIGKKNF